MMSTTSSPVAIELAQRIAPRLKSELESRKDSLIARAGSWVFRKAAALAWPRLIEAVPELTETGVDALLDEFGGMTLAELAGRIVLHQTAKGRQVSPSLRQASR
jgi:hypothetical protein